MSRQELKTTPAGQDRKTVPGKGQDARDRGGQARKEG